MTVITTFKEKKREKQIKYEKSVLREISIKALKEKVQQFFGSSRFVTGLMMNAGIEEACYDVAIEAYLLGANYSRFGRYGESLDQVRQRCEKEHKHLVDTLYNFFLYWGHGSEAVMSESLYYMCEQYVNSWWSEGFNKGERRHKLRLH
ncbi:YbaK family protein [Bacillus sp. CMF12]|uniref:YbaK family protein n=1 Tax=Bacillaceae TaxID=186817 RepID=UPI001FB539F6|nr:MULTISPECIES: YbaK family protein [Bacillaceae]UOE55661.1 YbaK family protein [Cytobacillus oceanisediminis]USK50118.1 YbaK family protein [Bacillus sp. CMF12]